MQRCWCFDEIITNWQPCFVMPPSGKPLDYCRFQGYLKLYKSVVLQPCPLTKKKKLMSFLENMRDRLPSLNVKNALSTWRENARDGSADNGPGVVIKRSLVAIVILGSLYYPIGMIMIHNVDDDLSFGPKEVLEGESHAVAVTAALIEREIDTHVWVANDPWFLPATALDNMPNFQQGMMSALGRFAFELTDQIGRTRGSSQTDTDLQSAAGLLQYPGDTWVWDPAVSLAPTATSEAQYRKAMRALRNYNKRLAPGNAVFERRADNLLATMDRIALDLGASGASLDQSVRNSKGWGLDLDADDVFYGVKGQAYAYYMVMRGLELDFEEEIRLKNVEKLWADMMKSLEAVATLQPMIVLNGEPDDQVMPSHLASQGFFLLRARSQLREITNILLK
jgi:hypothetical protein